MKYTIFQYQDHNLWCYVNAQPCYCAHDCRQDLHYSLAKLKCIGVIKKAEAIIESKLEA